MAETQSVTKDTGSRTRLAALLGASATLPGIGAALLPAVTCPACWPAYAGLLSSLGLGFIDYSPWLIPVTVVFLAVAVLALAWQGYQRHDYRPLAMGIIGSAILLVGKFQFESEVALYSGVALIIGASVWNARPQKVCPANTKDSSCGHGPSEDDG